MVVDGQIRRILQLYPDDCQAQAIETLSPPDSFSGAALWRLDTPRGTLCLRRWPAEHPPPERLQFVQAVLWHVDQEGFGWIPLPLETNHHHGFVRHDGHLWELTPWLAGQPDYRQQPSAQKLQNAMAALAHFHVAASSFPLPEPGPIASPGMSERTARLQSNLDHRLAQLAAAIAPDTWPELAERGKRLIELTQRTGPKLLPGLVSACEHKVALQPCIRDVWHAHVLFVGHEVSGIVDFGAMRADNVATDIARLLGSLAGDDSEDWQLGLAAYESVRLLSEDESALVTAFDRSGVVLGGLQWLEWVYLEGRQFKNQAAAIARVDELLSRHERLAQAVC